MICVEWLYHKAGLANKDQETEVKAVIFSFLLVMGLGLSFPAAAQSIDFGDDEGQWANDGECDDKRFVGPGMTDTVLLDEDVGHDRTDCAKAFKAGRLTLREVATETVIVDGIEFGTDESEWANDNECDDPRFEGPGMTETQLLTEDTRKDATDCLKAYQAGQIDLKTI